MLKLLHLCEVQSPPLWVRAIFLHRPRPAPCFVPLRSNAHPHRLLKTFQARSSASNAFATSNATSSQEVGTTWNLVKFLGHVLFWDQMRVGCKAFPGCPHDSSWNWDPLWLEGYQRCWTRCSITNHQMRISTRRFTLMQWYQTTWTWN